MREDIIKALKWRYAVKIFDPTKKISKEELETILESGRLAPSSIGMEPWKFFVVENPELRTKIRAASFDQPKVTDAPTLILIARRTDVRENVARELIERTAATHNVDHSELDGLKQLAEGGVGRHTDESLDAWVKSQAYIPLGIMVETAALLGVDACPMEGFIPEKIDEILGLKQKKLTATVLIAFGHRGADPLAEKSKVRRNFDDVVEFVR
jgi:nitroreductase/dihydropteridine reductase